jgi:hypothetical protein
MGSGASPVAVHPIRPLDRPKIPGGTVKVYEPRWDSLRNGEGHHLILGASPANACDWQTIDLPFDLIAMAWPWHDVDAIHCVSMLYQWDYVDALSVLAKCFAALRSGGVLWAGESMRDCDPSLKRLSCYTPNALGRILERTGFTVSEVSDSRSVTGRPPERGFALKGVKP